MTVMINNLLVTGTPQEIKELLDLCHKPGTSETSGYFEETPVNDTKEYEGYRTRPY